MTQLFDYIVVGGGSGSCAIASLFFVLGFFPSLGALTSACKTIVVLVLPSWMVLFGWQLLRRAPARVAPVAALRT